jgi:Cu2+-exporting ATPase
MIFELSLLGVGASYWWQRKRYRKPPQIAASPCAKPSLSIGHLWRDILSATQFADKDRLLMDIDPEFGQSREQARHAVRRQMYLSLGALGVTGMAVLWPVFFPLGVGAILYLSRENYRLIWRDFKHGHYLSFYLVSTIANLGMVATGHLILSAINGLVFGFLAGITNRLEDAAQTRLMTIFNNHPERVWMIRDGIEIQINFHELKVGDRVIVNAGEVVPVDGRIIGGMGQVDQHMLTGESQPVDKEVGDEVFASTLLTTGRMEVEVAMAGNKTVAGKITRILNQTQDSKDAMILRGRKTGDRFIPVKFGLAGLALSLLGPNAAMAVMWANLGNGLSTIGPIIVMTYLQLLARQKILVKDGRVFESLRKIDTLVFDKTGTLTQEQPTVDQVHALEGFTERMVLRLAAAAEYRQSHPIARAIIAHAKAENIELPLLEEASYEVGFGIKVVVEKQVIRVGSARFLRQEGIAFPLTVDVIQKQAEANSHSLIYVGVDNQLAGILEMQPTLRPEAKDTIRALQKRGLDIYIISGDHEVPTRRLAEQLGVQHYFAETLPENKADLVQQLKNEGRFVGFVGDGINDAIALKQAQVSISLKGASSVATDTAQIIFMDGTLKHLLPLFELVDEFEENMRRATIISFTPGVLTVAGVFFLNFGVLASLLILYLNICLGLSNALWPLVKHQKNQLKVETDVEPGPLPISASN